MQCRQECTLSVVSCRCRCYGESAEKCSPGGGIYELTASNPEVLGKFGIDVETIRLLINPASVGESSLVITDVLASTTVTLRVKLHVLFNSFDCRTSYMQTEYKNTFKCRLGQINLAEAKHFL